jgi:hypothetical protein
LSNHFGDKTEAENRVTNLTTTAMYKTGFEPGIFCSRGVRDYHNATPPGPKLINNFYNGKSNTKILSTSVILKRDGQILKNKTIWSPCLKMKMKGAGPEIVLWVKEILTSTYIWTLTHKKGKLLEPHN